MLKKKWLGTMCAVAMGIGLIAAPLPALAQTAQGTTNTTAKPSKPKREPTAGQLAARERQKKCAAEWKTAKAAGNVDKAMKWPQFWSACNKRLKAAG